MTSHPALHILRGALKGLIWLLLILVVAFFALTRTQTGRDELRRQMEVQFSERYQGRLAISQLRGNLLHDLYASDVRLFDPQGRLVVSIDSVSLHPNWRRFFQRTASMGRVKLFQPEIHLVRRPSGTWNLTEALQPIDADSSAGIPWAFTTSRLVIQNGLLTTQNEGPLPETVARGLVFDYTDASVEDLQARATIEWKPEATLIDILELSGTLTHPDFLLKRLSGQLALDGDQLSINQLVLSTGASYVALTGAFSPVSSLGTAGNPDFTVELSESHVAFDEWRPLFPRLPLRDAVTAEARIRGPLSELVIETINLRRGQTRLHGEGTVLGLPREADFDIAFLDNTVAAADLRAVLPDAAFPDFRHLGTLNLTLTGQGLLELPQAGTPTRVRARGELSVDGADGTMEGHYVLQRDPQEPLHYEATIQTHRFNVGRVLRRTALDGWLTGQWQLEGRTAADTEPQAHLTAALRSSRVGPIAFDSLHATVDLEAGRWQGRAHLFQQAAGQLFAAATYVPGDVRPFYAAAFEGYAFNMGSLLANDSLLTRLNGRLELEGSGRSSEALGGTVRLVLDSSAVEVDGTRYLVPPHETTLTLAPQSSTEPRLRIGGDVLEATLTGDATVDPVRSLAQLWSRAFVTAAQRAFHKPRPGATAATPPALDEALLLRAASALRTGDVAEPLALRLEAHLKRADILAALLPAFPTVQGTPRAELELHAGADSLRLRAHLTADSLHYGSVSITQLQSQLLLQAGPPDSLSHTLNTDLTLQGTAFRWNDQHFAAPLLQLRYADREAALRLTTGAADEPGPVRLAAALSLLPDRNRLTLSELHINQGDVMWRQPQPQHIDVYADAVVIPRLTLENQSVATRMPQRLMLQGTLSNAPQDTLLLQAEGIALHALSALAQLERPIGGLLDGQLAFVGGLTNPVLTGTLDVARLSFDGRLLGSLQMTSRYVPGSPEIALEAALSPPGPRDSLAVDRSQRLTRIEPSQLAVTGTFQLPRLQRGRLVDPGLLNLQLDVERADVFFFEYIFNDLVADVEGAVRGSASVTGTFRKPLFQANMDLRDGRFTVPKYNLRYSASGPVTVDARGIHLNGVRVQDPTEGSAAVRGSILFNDYRYFSFNLSARLQELQVINVRDARDLPFYGRIWASGDLTLTGPISNAMLRTPDAEIAPKSEISIPIAESASNPDAGFILFADSTGQLPDVQRLTQRQNLLAERPEGERRFIDGLDMDLNLLAPRGTTVHLVIDPLVGETISALGEGRIQLQREEGEFSTFGTLQVQGGEYLFTAGELFFRRFQLGQGGTITWDGDPVNPRLDLTASYRTRASTAGLPQGLAASTPTLIPVVIRLHITERVASPQVDLQLAIDRNDRDLVGAYEGLEAFLNQPERSAEYATSVLLTNSFLLTTSLASDQGADNLSDTRNRFAFNSLSQLVASQLNRYLSQAIPNFDVTLGLQGQSTQDIGVTYGVALRLLDERLIIRGQGAYQNETSARSPQGLEADFVVEVQLNPSVSVEVFYRREGDVLESQLTNTTGAGLSYETEFTTWQRLLHRLFGWLLPGADEAPPPEDETVAAEQRPRPAATTTEASGEDDQEANEAYQDQR